jgi:hypothetical protein
LEDNLQQLSYTLQPLSEVEQVEFLKKFWLQNSDLEYKDEYVTQIYAKSLIRTLAQSTSDKDREFTGIPLQIRLLAEDFKEKILSFYVPAKSEPELPHKLDVLELYGRFIDSKYKIFFKEKSKLQPGNMGADRIQERESKNIQVKHQLLALETLFTEDQVKFLQNYDQTAFSVEELLRIGIVQRNNEGKLYFIHHTFAEYFVADFLINQLKTETDQNEQVKELLINTVLFREDYHFIRVLIDGALENYNPSQNVLIEYGDLPHKLWIKGEGHLIEYTTVLHVAGAENNTHIIGFLLDSIKTVGHSTALKLTLLDEDSYGRTVWHVASEAGHIEVLEILWNYAKAQLTPSELKNKYLFRKNRDEVPALYEWEQRGTNLTQLKFLGWDETVNTKSESWLSRNGYRGSPWHFAAERGDVEMLEKLWE